jgi:hypothetical protein
VDGLWEDITRPDVLQMVALADRPAQHHNVQRKGLQLLGLLLLQRSPDDALQLLQRLLPTFLFHPDSACR